MYPCLHLIYPGGRILYNLYNIKDKNPYLVVKDSEIIRSNELIYNLTGYDNIKGIKVDDFWAIIKLEECGKEFEITAKNNIVRRVSIEVYEIKMV